MITIGLVIQEAINRLTDAITLFPQNTKIIETSEDDYSTGINPPYIGVYVDFDEDCEILPLGLPKDVPISIYALCHSAGEKTAGKSFEVALQMAMRTLKTCIGEYELPDAYWFIESQNKPFAVLQKSASGSVVLVQMKYNITMGDV